MVAVSPSDVEVVLLICFLTTSEKEKAETGVSEKEQKTAREPKRMLKEFRERDLMITMCFEIGWCVLLLGCDMMRSDML